MSLANNVVNVNIDELVQKWTLEQEALAKSVITTDEIANIDSIKLVGGLDISFVKDTDKAVVTLAILSFPDLKLVHQLSKSVEMKYPYIPGFLAFREIDHFMDLLNSLDQKFKPDVLFVDGNGLLHYRKFGSACHIGVISGIPTIGVSKNLLNVEQFSTEYLAEQMDKIKATPGSSFKLVGLSGFVYGACLVTATSIKHPIYVSIGNKITLDTAIKLVSSCVLHRILEPIRQADLMSRKILRDNVLEN